MKEITIEKKGFEDKCPICRETFQALSESQMEYNMKLHKEKCKRLSFVGKSPGGRK